MNFSPISVGRYTNQTYGSWAPLPLIHWDPTIEQYENAEAITVGSSLGRPTIVAWNDISRTTPRVYGQAAQGGYPASETNGMTSAYRIGDRMGGSSHVTFASSTWDSFYDVVHR